MCCGLLNWKVWHQFNVVFDKSIVFGRLRITSRLCYGIAHLLGWHIWWQLVRSKWTNSVASKFSRPHPTRLFSLRFCEEWCVFTATHGHWKSSKKRFAQLFKKLHLRCYITHGMQYLHDMNCVVYAMVVMSRSNLIWTKLPCFKNAYAPYWKINSYSSPFMMYSFCVFPNGSTCIIKLDCIGYVKIS